MPVLLAPPIHVRPAPAVEPPFEDGPMVVAPSPTQPTLPLDWSTPRRSTAAQPPPAAAVAPAQRRSGRRNASPARGAVMHFLSLCLEVFNGHRPVFHLRALVAPTEFAGIADEIGRAMGRLPEPPGRRRTVRTRPPDRHRAAPRLQLRELRVYEPRPGIAEAAAVIGDDDRAWALAIRLERRTGGWQCTVAHVL